MTTVQAKIQAIEDKNYRDALLEREARNSKVTKMFFDDRQLRLYGAFANQISTPRHTRACKSPTQMAKPRKKPNPSLPST